MFESLNFLSNSTGEGVVILTLIALIIYLLYKYIPGRDKQLTEERAARDEQLAEERDKRDKLLMEYIETRDAKFIQAFDSYKEAMENFKENEDKAHSGLATLFETLIEKQSSAMTEQMNINNEKMARLIRETNKEILNAIKEVNGIKS